MNRREYLKKVRKEVSNTSAARLQTFAEQISFTASEPETPIPPPSDATLIRWQNGEFLVQSPSGTWFRVPINSRGLEILERNLKARATAAACGIPQRQCAHSNPTQWDIDNWLRGRNAQNARVREEADAEIATSELGI